MGGIANGQPVADTTDNTAFLFSNGDDIAIGILSLENTDGASGAFITNIQRALNTLYSATGADDAAADGTTYGAPAGTITDGDSHQLALTKLSNKFDQTTGHKHTGAAGDGPQVEAVDLDEVPLRGSIIQGTDLIGETGTSSDISTELTGKSPSSNSTTLGVPVNVTGNKVVIRQATGVDTDDVYKDALGNIVYGRITEAAAVWTLSYFVDIAGVETAYNFAGASDIRWYYQELFNPMGGLAPVYSEFANTPSDNTTSDVITATEILEGIVRRATNIETTSAVVQSQDTRLPLQGENDALVGSDGTPSGANPYVTDSDPRNTDARTPTAHAASHESGGGDVVAHQNLSGSGTNTHAQIDSHISSSANPHSVTPAQVGNSTAQWNADQIQGVNVQAVAPGDTQVLAYNLANLRYEPTNSAAAVTTTKGDIASHTTVPARKPIGTEGQIAIVRAANSFGWDWETHAPAKRAVKTVATTATLLLTDDLVLAGAAGGAYTITLPAIGAGDIGKTLFIKKNTADFNVITIDADGADTINSALTSTLCTNNESLEITVTAAARWDIVNRNIDSTWASVTLTGTMNNTNYTVEERRVKNHLELKGYMTFSGVPTLGNTIMTLPHSLQFDGWPGSTSQNLTLGISNYHETGVDVKAAGSRIRYQTATTFILSKDNSAYASNSPIAAWNPGDEIFWYLSAPIANWRAD